MNTAIRFLICAFILLFVVSCQDDPANTNASADQVVIDKIAASDTYVAYVAAYKDYLSCKQERPVLTQDYLDKKITQEQFSDAITRNARVCRVKQDIYNRYYALLQAEFDKEAEKYKIVEE